MVDSKWLMSTQGLPEVWRVTCLYYMPEGNGVLRGLMRLALQTIALLLLLLASAAVASADTVQLTLVNGGNDVLGGVYVGPYNFTGTSNGQTVPLQLVCDDYSHDVFPGETWTSTTSSYTALNISSLQFSGSTLQSYLQAAWLTQQIFANLGNAQLVGWMQYALWDLFTAGASSGLSQSDQNQVNTWLANAAANYNCAACDYSNVLIYTPVPGTQKPGSDGLPQEYLGIDGPGGGGSGNTTGAPEPATLLLMATGLSGLFAFRRRLSS